MRPSPLRVQFRLNDELRSKQGYVINDFEDLMNSDHFHRHGRNYGCRIREFIYREHRCLTIENELLRVLIVPDKGADILEFLYKPLDLDFMWHSRHGLRRASHFRSSTPLHTGHFREYFAGGWFEMLPNGPRPCTYRGAEFGYHGEATLLPWEYEILVDEPERVEVRFAVRLVRTPLFVEKTIRLDGESATLYVSESIVNEASQTVEILWGQHPTFGPPFLAENCQVYVPPCRAIVGEDVPSDSRLAPSQTSIWPVMHNRSGATIDISRVPGPEARSHDFVRLEELSDGWFAIVNPERKAGFALHWDINVFPVLGFWQLFHGAPDYPWYGMNYLVALEPAVDLPSLEDAALRGTALSLEPALPFNTSFEATAFQRPLEVRAVNVGGVIK
jgi:hypothetical protein